VTTYRLYDGVSGRPGVGSSGTQPPASATAFSGNYCAGINFQVTQSNMWFQGYWWWVASGAPTAPQKFALWSAGVPSGSGVVVPGSVVTSGTLSAGMNFIPLATPVPISIGSPYVASTAVNGSFPLTQNQYGPGNPYASGVTNGPLNAPQTFASSQYGLPQSPFTVTVNDPTLAMPTTNDQNDILWLDVAVSDTAPAGYSGTYRLWPNKFDGGPTIQGDVALPFILATEVRTSQSCIASRIWFFSTAGATSLPTWAGVWRISDQSLVVANTSPSWISAATGGAASIAGGWCYCTIPSTALVTGNYKVAAYNANGGNGTWSCTIYGYFLTGVGLNGVTTGPLSSPKMASASTAYVYFNNPAATPPYTDGHSQEAANGTFARTGLVYPYLEVDYLFPGTSDPVGAVAEWFGLDLEVTAGSQASASLTVTPARTASATRAATRTASLTATPSRSATRLRSATRTAALTTTPSRQAAAKRAATRTAALQATPATTVSTNHVAVNSPVFLVARARFAWQVSGARTGWS
jgi:hypothetical protein